MVRGSRSLKLIWPHRRIAAYQGFSAPWRLPADAAISDVAVTARNSRRVKFEELRSLGMRNAPFRQAQAKIILQKVCSLRSGLPERGWPLKLEATSLASFLKQGVQRRLRDCFIYFGFCSARRNTAKDLAIRDDGQPALIGKKVRKG